MSPSRPIPIGQRRASSKPPQFRFLRTTHRGTSAAVAVIEHDLVLPAGSRLRLISLSGAVAAVVVIDPPALPARPGAPSPPIDPPQPASPDRPAAGRPARRRTTP